MRSWLSGCEDLRGDGGGGGEEEGFAVHHIPKNNKHLNVESEDATYCSAF